MCAGVLKTWALNSQLQYKRIQEHVNKTSVKQKHGEHTSSINDDASTV